ncbi:WD40-repeat-containing domain protein [Pyronema omphalodes]|nr:WD40-repeat-containing domain protein [Pyronema omphalodes]
MSNCGQPSAYPPLIPSASASSSAVAAAAAGGSSRPTQGFNKIDEGYSGEEVQTPGSGNDSQSGTRDQMSDIKIPSWVTNMDPGIRLEFVYKLIRTLPTSHISTLVNRLEPILHLDFIQILPSELSLQILSYLPPKSLLDASLTSRTWRKFALEPRLWKDLYKRQGWEADEEEIRKFELEMQARAEKEMRQQVESKRKAEENREEERKAKEARTMNFTTAMDTSQDGDTYVIDQTGQETPYQYGGQMITDQRASTAVPTMLSDDEEMYPTPKQRPSAMSEGFIDAPLPIEPTLTTPGYGSPRLNWAFLFKNRRRLEKNWMDNKCVPFQIPHPNYPHEAHTECIYAIQYSAKWLCSGSRDKTVRIWNTKTRRARGEPLIGHTGSVLCLQFDESPEEDVIISGSSDSCVIVWRFSTGEKLQVLQAAHGNSVLNLRFNKKWLVTCSKDHTIKAWNRRPLHTDSPDYPWDSKVVFGPNGAPTSHPHHPLYQPSWTIQDPAASSGLNLLNPFAHGPKQVTPKTIPAYTAITSFEGHAAAVNAVQMHGDEIASASGDRTIKLWNMKTGKCEKTFIGHQKGIACVQFDGNTIVSGSSDQTIRIFDRHTQAETTTLRGHTALVRTIQATQNRIVSGSYDETVRVWLRNPNTGMWQYNAVLRQSRVGAHPSTDQNHNHLSSQMQHTTLGQVQMHPVHQVGGAGFAGAVVAAQLIPQTQHTQAQQIQAHLHQQFLQMQQNQQPALQQQVAGALTAANATTNTGGNYRVFKLQFDARWIICCTQDTKIVGWDYAADDEDIIEASRFFAVDP